MKLWQTLIGMVIASLLIVAACEGRDHSAHNEEATGERHPASQTSLADVNSVLTLGGVRKIEENSNAINVNPVVTSDPAGGFLVADRMESQMRRYTREGKLVWSVGKKGDGPGEYQNIARAIRMPDGSIVAADFHGRLVRYTKGADSILSTFRVPVDRIDQMMALDNEHLVIGGIDRRGNILHVWNLVTSREEASFFNPLEHVKNESMARYAFFAPFDIRGDTIAVVFSINDSIFFFTRGGQHIGKLPVSSKAYRRVASVTPPDVNTNPSTRARFMSSFDMFARLHWLSDGSFVLSFRNIDPSAPLTSLWHVMHMNRNGELLGETQFGRLLTVDAATDSLYMLSPSAEGPNRWVAAIFRH